MTSKETNMPQRDSAGRGQSFCYLDFVSMICAQKFRKRCLQIARGIPIAGYWLSEVGFRADRHPPVKNGRKPLPQFVTPSRSGFKEPPWRGRRGQKRRRKVAPFGKHNSKTNVCPSP